MIELDGTDHEILELLLVDGRRSVADIATHVALSAPAVKRRIDRLEAGGVITGYTAIVDDAALGRPLEAFCELRFSGNTLVEDIAGIGDGIEEVHSVYTLAGDPDALALIRVRDVADLRRVIDLLRRTGKIMGTKTLMVLDGAGSVAQRP